MTIRFTVAISAAALACADAAAATVGYTLGRGGNALIRFDVGAVAGATEVALSTRLDAIDFRPATGQLFGYSSSADRYYVIDPDTGAVTLFPLASGQSIASTQGNNVDIDWNPTIDRLRTVGTGDENIVFNPNTGAAASQTPLFYGAGDVNAGINPNVVGNAYTQSFFGPPGGGRTTQQYVIDSGTNAIATLANNAGTLSTLGVLTLGGAPFDFNADAGFDIAFLDGQDVYYALLSQGGLSTLFTIDIATRELTSLGSFARSFGSIRGLAIAIDEVPLPAGALLFPAGLGAVAGLRRCRKAVAG